MWRQGAWLCEVHEPREKVLLLNFPMKKLKYELIVQNSWVLCCLLCLVHTAMRGSWGARAAGWKCCAFKGGKKKSLALWSLRSGVLLVTPNFRENHTEEGGEGEDNAIFLVIILYIHLNTFPYVYFLCCKPRLVLENKAGRFNVKKLV